MTNQFANLLVMGTIYQNNRKFPHYSKTSLIRKVWDQGVFGLLKCSDWQNHEYRQNINVFHLFLPYT